MDEKVVGLEVRKVKINVLERILRKIEDFSRVFGLDERSKRVFSIILWRSSSFERSKTFSDDKMYNFSLSFLKSSNSKWNVSLNVPLGVPLNFPFKSTWFIIYERAKSMK